MFKLEFIDFIGHTLGQNWQNLIITHTKIVMQTLCGVTKITTNKQPNQLSFRTSRQQIFAFETATNRFNPKCSLCWLRTLVIQGQKLHFITLLSHVNFRLFSFSSPSVVVIECVLISRFIKYESCAIPGQWVLLSLSPSLSLSHTHTIPHSLANSLNIWISNFYRNWETLCCIQRSFFWPNFGFIVFFVWKSFSLHFMIWFNSIQFNQTNWMTFEINIYWLIENGGQ